MDNNAQQLAQFNRIRRMTAIAMRAQDDFVLRFVYQDRSGRRTRRTVSPVRFISPTQFSALCLCREEVRQFAIERCSEAVLVHASEVLMPVDIQILEPGEIGK